MIEIAIRSLLVADPTVNAIVGDRIFVDQTPQAEEVPAIVLNVIEERALDALDGPLGMDQPLMRVYAYGATRAGADALRGAIRNVLAGFQGISENLWIKGIAQEFNRGKKSQVDRVRSGTDQYRYVTVQDYRISYDYEPIP